MKITFLGTAAGLPCKGRASSSTMIEVNKKYYIIDAGAPIVNRFVDSDRTLDDLRAVFITHCHLDHLLGIIDVIRCVNIPKIFKEANVSYYLPEEGVLTAIKNYFSAFMGGVREDVNHFNIYTEGVLFEDESLKVTAIPTAHLRAKDRPSYAFIVECEGKRILFTGDLSHGLKYDDYPKVAFEEYFDLVVSESTHFDLFMVFPSFEKASLGRLVFNHVSQWRIPEIEAESRSGKYPFPITIAYDGYCLEL